MGLPHKIRGAAAAAPRITYIWETGLLRLGASGDQSLAGVVGGVLGEVLYEAGGQILGLGVPLGGVSVGVAGIQDVGVHAGQLGGNGQVEVGDGLGLRLQDGTVQDGVDDAAGVLDGDTLAGAVPAGVDEVCASAAGDFPDSFSIMSGSDWGAAVLPSSIDE